MDDPYHEQRLIEEVIYLHSLWHQGPPRINYNPNPNHYHNICRHLQPSNATQFKRERKTPRGRKGNKWPLRSDPLPISDIEWPCKPPADIPPTTLSGWPSLNLQSTQSIRLPSAEEQARFAANQAQQKASKATQEFFASNADSDGDDNDEDSEDEDDYMMDEDECDEYQFFSKVFTEDSELRGYYEKNYESGEFCCLVCGGVGKKVGKRFKDCVALVQHSTAIGKTKKKRAHRAYGQVICKFLGWDIAKLPTIVASLANSRSLAKSGESQGNADDGDKEDSVVLRNNVALVSVDDGEAVPKMDSNDNEVLPDEAVDLSKAVDGELMICENSENVADANKTEKDLDKGVSNIAKRNAEGVVNHLCRNLTTTMVLEVVEME